MQNKRFPYEGIELGGPRHFYRQELILRFLEGSQIKGRVLDAGCGDGCASLKLAKKGWEVYALDYSLDFLGLLKEKLVVRKLIQYVKICHQNLEFLDFPNSFFDAIVCGEVLEHMEDDYKIMNSFNRILQPGGICVVSVPIFSKRWDASDDFFGHRRLYSLKGFRKLVEANGFLLERYLFWGFPLMKLYYYLIYLNWFKRAGNYKEKQKDLVTKVGKSRIVSFIGAKIFRFDEIFGRRQWGLGLVARIIKIRDLE